AAATPQKAQHEIAYLAAPPALPEVAPPGKPPTADSFFVPGHWTWEGTRYVWRAGYWAHVQPGYVWVPAHYRWTPSGYVFIAGYCAMAIDRRGVLSPPPFVRTHL